MGGTFSGGQMFSREEWEVVSKTPDFNVIKSLTTYQQYQEHHKVFADEEEFTREKKVYLARQFQSNDAIVRVEAVKECVKKGVCSTQYELTVYTQHLPITIDKTQEMDFSCAVHTMIKLLAAVKTLSKQFSFFELDQSKVFVNSKGLVKVWISNITSDNWACCKEGSESEQQMVSRIVDIIQGRTSPGCIPLNFIKPLRFNNYNLDDAMGFVTRYCSQHQISVANSLANLMCRLIHDHSTDSALSRNTGTSLQKDCRIQQQRTIKRYNHSVLDSIINDITSGRKSKVKQSPRTPVGCEY